MGIDEYSILKKKPKKNAFAATALLVSIAIALLVMVGAVLVLSKVNDKDRITTKEETSETAKSDNSDSTTCEGLVKEIVFNDNLKTIKEAAISYFTNERLPKNIGDKTKITIGAMQDKKLLLNVRDASANTCDKEKSYVEVTKEKDEYLMKIFLSCSDMEDYIIVHLGCYDYCDKDVCEKEVEPEKVFEYEYKKTTSCVMGDWSSWGQWKTTREKTSNLKKEDIKTETTSKETIEKTEAIASATYNCDKYPGYTQVGAQCVKDSTITDIQNAEKNPTTYNCKKYPGYTVVGDKCVKDVPGKIEENADPNPTTYNCKKYPDYTLEGDKCIKVSSSTDSQPADKIVKYTCPVGYTLNDKECSRKVNKDTKVTYYRYATRTCNGGSTSIKWSTSQNDSILKGEGYKLTGNKREIKEIIK